MSECEFGCINKTQKEEKEEEENENGEKGKVERRRKKSKSFGEVESKKKSIGGSQYIIAEQNLNEKVADPLIK